MTDARLHVVFLDALCLYVTFCRIPGHPQAIHLRPQSHKLFLRHRARLSLELPQNSSILLRVLGMIDGEIAGVQLVQHLSHVVVQIVRRYLATEGVGVREQ